MGCFLPAKVLFLFSPFLFPAPSMCHRRGEVAIKKASVKLEGQLQLFEELANPFQLFRELAILFQIFLTPTQLPWESQLQQEFPKDPHEFAFLLVLTQFLSRGEKGILAHPQRPPNFRELCIFPPFFLLISTETKITHPKSHFTYAIKHNFSLLILTHPLTLFSACDRADFGKIPKISNSF